MLPGKYCIGILEEDNPLKSYFRLKPLLVENEGKYEYFDAVQMYPEEGCIRIVPDKNESSHFKARMRRMGRYCVLDLRDHGGENDKIRPNKNYHGDESEKNAHIVYSDVVREPAPDMIFEVAAFDTESGIWEGAAPGTPRVITAESLETWRYMPDEEGELAHIEKDGSALLEEEIQRFEIPGFPGESLRLVIKLPATMPNVLGVTPPRAAQSAPVQAAEPAAAPKAEAAPAPVQEEKPWISHGHMPPPPKSADQRMSPMQQSLAAQSGLNPRRNRSLQEIIEEKWRHSRVDQLGHPVPVHAMGTPVANPVEHAMDVLRNAWNIPGVHDELVEALSRLPEFTAQVQACGEDRLRESRRRELEDLEAERLKGLAALDKLRRDKHALRESFKQEIRQEEAAAFKDAVARTKAAQAECKKYETQAEEARLGAEMARDAFAALNDGRFEEKLKDFALTSRAAELLSKPLPEVPDVPAAPEAPDREEWLRRLKAACACEGLQMDGIQLANLLACAALSDSLIFSGAAASDKLPTARALARALGNWKEVYGGRKLERCDADVIVVDQANCMPDVDVRRGMGGKKLLSVAADSDSGFPISAEALEQAFLIRVQAPAADAPWKPAACAAEEFAPACPDALRRAFLSDAAELTPAMEKRMQQLRSSLGMHGVRLSRNTLDQMWRYCAVMLEISKASPAEILDLAFAQKALPCILAEAPVECLKELKGMLADMPRSRGLLEVPLPVLI